MIVEDYEEFCRLLDLYIGKYRGKFGCIITFNGFVREYDLKDGEKVPTEGITIEKDIFRKLNPILDEAKRRFGIIDVLFYHNTGFLKVGERIASIAVFAKHRGEGFKALEFIVEEMKKHH